MRFFEVEGLRKRFGNTRVLDALSFSVDRGEFVTLLGPSGCGKSTLLRCVAGLEEPEEGVIRLEGRDITRLAPKDRQVGLVFQSYALFPNMTVFENIAFGLRMRGVDRWEIAQRVGEMLRLVHLEEKRDAYPHELSGGQQQRVALARSLVVRPKLLLLDEPFSALDAKIRKNLRTELRRIQQELGMTTILVTHDQEEALTLSDRVLVMDRGQIVQAGTPEEVYTAPRTEFVARFIGHYNVIAGEEMRRLTGDDSLKGERFAVRPEAIRLLEETEAAAFARPEGARGWELRGRVKQLSFLGNIVRVEVESGGLIFHVDMLNHARHHALLEGTPVVLFVPREECRALDSDG